MDDQAHRVLVLEPDADDAHRLCDMIDSAVAACKLHVWHLDTASVTAALVPRRGPDVILLEADLSSNAEMATAAAICQSVDAPVVVVTTTADPSRHCRVLAHGAADCLVKWAFDDAALARCLTDAIRRTKRTRERQVDVAAG